MINMLRRAIYINIKSIEIQLVVHSSTCYVKHIDINCFNFFFFSFENHVLKISDLIYNYNLINNFQITTCFLKESDNIKGFVILFSVFKMFVYRNL